MKELTPFLKRDKEGIIGHKIETFESKQYVTAVPSPLKYVSQHDGAFHHDFWK